ncbi:MAG: pyridoxal-phosphate dependent enzyme [Actinomycetota bacterium]|nr:pyridoxal-phosphate dependent enzyme [Actinomycetota bacterium]
MSEPSLRAIEAAKATIAGVARRTPMLEAGEISRRAGAAVTLKAECLQATGSFKVRGAYNAIAALTEAEVRAGVVAASAGNHAQAVAAAAREAGARADLFMPAEAPLAKLAAVRRRAGNVHLVPGPFAAADEAAHAFASSSGATLVPAFDHPAVIAGQGTIGLEIADQAPETNLVLVPVGGGALAAGIAIAVKAKLDGARVVGVQAQKRAGATICDGIAVKDPGELTQPLLDRWLDDLVAVSDDEAAEAMVLLLERSKLVVEGAGAVGVGALLSGKVKLRAQDEVCAVLSGGNVDATRLTECIALGETVAGRRIVVSVVLPDRPGALAGLLRVVADQRANVIEVEHLREGLDLHVGETGITLVLQTKGPEHSAELLAAFDAEGFAVPPRTRFS